MERRQEGGVERPGVEAGDHRHEQRRGLGIDADCDTAAGGRSRHPPRSLLQHSSPRCCLRPTFHPQCRTHQGSTSSYHALAADTSLRRRRNCSPLSIQELRRLSVHFLFFSLTKRVGLPTVAWKKNIVRLESVWLEERCDGPGSRVLAGWVVRPG